MPGAPPHAIARAAEILGMRADDLAERLGGGQDAGRLAGDDLEARDRLLRSAAAQHYAGVPSLAGRADRLRDALNRYATTTWRQRDQWAESNPHQPGSRPAEFWAILRLSSRVPSARTIRRLLATAPPYGQPNRPTSQQQDGETNACTFPDDEWRAAPQGR